MQVLIVTCPNLCSRESQGKGFCKHKVEYYSSSVASKLVSKNFWKEPVKGIHPETLRNSFRNSGSVHGVKIGRDVFFRISDLILIGYEADTSRLDDVPKSAYTFLGTGELPKSTEEFIKEL